jgi:hypothetical protein
MLAGKAVKNVCVNAIGNDPIQYDTLGSFTIGIYCTFRKHAILERQRSRLGLL